ncbi:hypothetical protein [Usitatibacter rugosus]|uniref:hypothetical protein n=1 Tax=Usitatibacter rugosus TaxID=2732067 RepID=UPI001489436A|nr:hypothetical protein [Usitatibacter rugosus]
MALALLGVAFLIVRGISGTESTAGSEVDTRKKLQKVSEALVRFAVENRRLPCSAQGTVDTGDAAPTGAAAACTDSAGVVPWRTLGLAQEDALDGWGRKISYRVYSGITGYTQVNGFTATDCNADIAVSMGALAAGGLCNTGHTNTAGDFTAGKGFPVNDQGTVRTGVAFALISHGATGFGAYLPQGGRMTVPTGGGQESSNATGTAPYFVASHSAAGVPPADSTHFDDVVVYKLQNDLVNDTRLIARKWGASPGTLASQSFTRAVLDALPGLPGSNNLGTNAIDFGAFTITAGISGRNLSSGVLATGEGIGTILTGGTTSSATTLSSSANESLRITFDPPGQPRSLGIMITDLSRLSASNSERVRFTFYSGGSLFATIIKDQCISGHVQANYALDPGATFDRVDVAPISTTTGGGASTILLGALQACTADITPGLCVVPATPTGARNPANDCP